MNYINSVGEVSVKVVFEGKEFSIKRPIFSDREVSVIVEGCGNSIAHAIEKYLEQSSTGMNIGKS